eukprot:356677-Chlamydomonas_euryale.AAC.1
MESGWHSKQTADKQLTSKRAAPRLRVPRRPTHAPHVACAPCADHTYAWTRECDARCVTDCNALAPPPAGPNVHAPPPTGPRVHAQAHVAPRMHARAPAGPRVHAQAH